MWQKAIQFAELVYQSTKSFPQEGRFGLTNQIRRAAVSISSNIAEGSSRQSRTDFARFVEIATGSLFECASRAFLSKQLGFLSEAGFNEITIAAEEQSRTLSGLRLYLINQ